jgi:dihydroorotate dehydrogenase
MYHLLFWLLLRHIPAERAHALAKDSLRLIRATPPGRAAIRRLVGPTPRCLAIEAFGLTFRSPLGVAAGLDKDATWFDDLGGLGFGFVEVGTITALPQAGNPPPRVARFVQDRALLNRMGFPNNGAAAAAERLRSRAAGTIVGVNIGKSMAVPLDDAATDYGKSARLLAPVADYLVLNVSSPNTPGLRDLQAPDELRSLVAEVRGELGAIDCNPPLLIKIGPDLEDERLDAIVALAVDLRLDGIVAVNTTSDYSVLEEASAVAASLGGGGVSGAPLGPRALEILRRIRRLAGDRLVVISVGGVESAEDVWQRLLAGATLVQVYTALIYEGPAWPARVNRELAQRVRAAGVSSVADLIGAEAMGSADEGKRSADERKGSADERKRSADEGKGSADERKRSADERQPSTPVQQPSPAEPRRRDFPARQDRAQ